MATPATQPTQAPEPSGVLSRMLSKNFDVTYSLEEPSLTQTPLTDDTQFEYINLDIGRLNAIKKTSFWTYLINQIQPHSRFGEVLTIDRLISYYPKFEEPLFPLKAKLFFFVEKIYTWIIRLIGEAEPPCKSPEDKIRKIINLSLENHESLRDEIFLTLIKLVRNNAKPEAADRVWYLLSLFCGILQPSPAFLPAIYNYLISVIDNYPDERIKDSARYALKRLYYLDKNRFKRCHGPSNKEIIAVRNRKKICIAVHLQNGSAFHLFEESYTTASELLTMALKQLGIPQHLWCYFGLVDNVTKSKALDERLLSEHLMLGDILMAWELLKRSLGETMKSNKIFLVLKFFPTQPDHVGQLLPFVYFTKLYDMYYGKTAYDQLDILKLWGICMQVDFGDFEEKPGLPVKIRNYYHPFFAKYFKDETIEQQVLSHYQQFKGQKREACMRSLIGIEGAENEFPMHYFVCKFRNSNNQTYKDLQENLILGISRDSVAILEDVSRERILEVKLQQIMSWGFNNDILVICFGDKYEVTKMYFLVHNPYAIGELLFNYASLASGSEPADYLAKNTHLEKFIENSKARKANVFNFK